MSDRELLHVFGTYVGTYVTGNIETNEATYQYFNFEPSESASKAGFVNAYMVEIDYKLGQFTFYDTPENSCLECRINFTFNSLYRL